MAMMLQVFQGTEYQPPIEELTVNGAITIKMGTVFLNKAGVLAATLASPTSGADDNKELTIIAMQAQANTVTLTAGFNGGGTASDVATFGGAIGDSMTIVAYKGVWYVKNLVNVTLA